MMMSQAYREVNEDNKLELTDDDAIQEEKDCEGHWIPVSVPPMSESSHDEWNLGPFMDGGYFPDGDLGWDQFIGDKNELTMWDVVTEMLLAAQGRVSSLASKDIGRRGISWLSDQLLEQAWKEMAQTLTEANSNNVHEILEAEPPRWLTDSAASACRSLLPVKFRTCDPTRVCDVCCVRLEPVQTHLMDQVSRASQLPTHDLMDLSTLRSWLNFPLGNSMEYEIYKATNTIQGYNKVGSLTLEKAIPHSILKHAKGLAILTVAKVGMMVTYNVGTGIVIARNEDGSWSAPSAISTFGMGWGLR
ncbi:hypothetical protein QQ045_004978 [Rhodiola kirilowii]